MKKEGKNIAKAHAAVEKRPYVLQDAVPLLQKVKFAKFDETVEITLRLGVDPKHAELAELGELVDAQGLAGPEQAKFVVSDGMSAPVITDGPYPESKELLAGYRLVDVESAQRAIEIAARASASPGQDGVPIRQRIEVREVLSAPDPEL